MMCLLKAKRALESIVIATAISLASPANAGVTPPDQSVEWEENNKTEARVMVLAANLAIGCLKSGIGAFMHDQGFSEGCGKGTLAGIVAYAGELTATYSKKRFAGASGKLVYDLGISMQDNVMRGESMLSQYQTDLGPVTLTFKQSPLPKISFTLTPAVGIAVNLLQKNKFDAKQSIYNLTPVFKIKNQIVESETSTSKGASQVMWMGYTIGNVVAYSDYNGLYSDYDLKWLSLSHETNHALFFSKMRFCGDILSQTETLEKLHKWWNLGQDIGYYTIGVKLLSDDEYYLPNELEAYSMQRYGQWR